MNTELAERIANAVVEDGEQCDIETVERLAESLDSTGQKWLETASEQEIYDWAYDVLINTQPGLSDHD